MDCLVGSKAGCLLDQSGIESSGLTQRNGIDRMIAVDDVTPENHRNTKAGFLDGNTLVVVRLLAHTVEHGTCPRTHLIGKVVGDPTATDLRHLTDFLFERHLGQQAVNFLLGGVFRRARRQNKAGYTQDVPRKATECMGESFHTITV